MPHARTLTILLFVTAAAWHLFSVFVPPDGGKGPIKETLGRDFASYYYAAKVAATGADPYDTEALSASARADQTRDEVHPFFYPPPYLLLVAWAPSVDLKTGYAIWYWVQELALLVAMLALFLWWRPLADPRTLAAAIAVWVALMWGVVYGHVMGQVNCVVLAVVLLALWQDAEDRPWVGGALMGLACMWKMSPAVFVAWWLLRRRWAAAGAAIAAAVLLSVLALPLVGLQHQVEFYTQVMPRFASGDYNGLTVKIDMFGNHSLPNLVNQLLPGEDHLLSADGSSLVSVLNLALVGAIGWLFRDPPVDTLARDAQLAAVSAASLLVPVYTYEHHLVWLLPALVVCTVAVWNASMPRWMGWLLGACGLALVVPLPWLKSAATFALDDLPVVPWVLQEARFAAILIPLAGAIWLGSADHGAGLRQVSAT